MRLTSIRLAGFKSFVDPTTLSLASNLTGVVGPNGCGKSNVIDAVRWVTGESNARQLRGEALEDVIFNGSKARKPVGRASVELRFDNSEDTLGGQYGAFAEISIKRELARDGGSRYFINGAKARRRDVIDLFLGTGLGGRSNYAVIEQGAVNRLIEARPEDMRQVLEEAAGISKYKERRRETETRIRHTRENLDRLNDLVGEVTQRLAVLKRQAANAEKYKTLKVEERTLRAESLALRWSAQNVQTQHAEAALRETETQLREAISARRQAQDGRDADSRAQQAATAEVQTCQAAFHDAQSQVGRIEQALAHARELLEIRTRERATFTERLAALETRQAEDLDRQAGLSAEAERARQSCREAEQGFAAARAVRSQAEAEAQAAEQAWDAHGNATHNPVAQLEAERIRAGYAQEQRDKLVTRQQARSDERERMPATDDQALADAEQDLVRCQQRLETDQQAAVDVAVQDDALVAETAEMEDDVAARRRELAEQQAELASEKKMQQAVLREDDATLNAWLAEHGHGQARGVARRVRVRDAWQTAAETALGPLLRGFVVESLERVAINAWPGEPLALIEDREIVFSARGDAPAGLDCLADGLDGPAAIRAAAADIFVVDDLNAGLAVRDQLGAGQQLITLDGCRIGPASLITPAGQAAEQGVFEREQRIERLSASALDLQAVADTRQQALEDTREQRRAAGERRRALDEAIGQQRRELETARAELQGARVRAEQTRRRRAEIETELAELAEQIEAVGEEADTARARLDELEEEARAFTAAREQARERLADARRQRDRARAEAGRAERSLREVEADIARAVDRAESLAARMADTRTARDDIAARIEAFDGEQPADNHADYSDDDLVQAQESRARAERELRATRQALTDTEKTLERRAQALMAADQGVDEARETLQQARIEVETAGVRRAGVAEQLEELGHAPLTLLEDLPDDADAARWHEQIETLERRIQRLGAINLAAIDEYDAEAEREQYLAAQHKDLTEALDTLEAAIAKIDRETRSRFKATFEQVNARFSEMFPELFGGGEAALELTEDDWLATGIRVMARPPGKRNASIQMLSGGEKALTAVALLFALFELNPAPFCMLDEIDAPLDDANVSRFCELVRRMSAQVQFIVITHNKLTMSLAEQLHGVTMAEPGVSRLVSVDIEQALDMAG